MRLFLIILLLAVLMSPEADAQQRGDRRNGNGNRVETAPASGGGYAEEYGVLSDRNMFLRERSRPRNNGGGSNGRGAPATQDAGNISTEPTSVLRGVVFEDGEHRAYFESVPGATIQRVAVGDELGKGRIAEIAIDAVLFETDGQSLWIEMGHDLTGAKAATMPSRGAGSSAAASTTGGSSGVAPGAGGEVDASGMTLEERMRLRRQERR